MRPIQIAAKTTRPAKTPLPRGGMDKWEDPEFLRRVIEQGGFSKNQITLSTRQVLVTTTNINHYANMLSFIGGTSAAGWLASDEAK